MGICKTVGTGKVLIGKVVLGIAVLGLGIGMKGAVSSAAAAENAIGITTRDGKSMSFTAVENTEEEAVFSLNSDGSARLKSGSIGMGADSTIKVGKIKVKNTVKKKSAQASAKNKKAKIKKESKTKTISIELVTAAENKGIAVIEKKRENMAEVALEEGDTITANGGVTATAGKGGAVLKVSYDTKTKKAVWELLSGSVSNEGGLLVTLFPGDTKTKLPIGVEGSEDVMVTAKKDGTYRVKISSEDTGFSLAEESYMGREGTIVYTIDTDSNVYVHSITLRPGEMTDEIMTGGKRMTISNAGTEGEIKVQSGNLATITADSGSKMEVGLGKKSRTYTAPVSETGKVTYEIHKNNQLEQRREKEDTPGESSVPSMTAEQSQLFFMNGVNNFLHMVQGNRDVGRIVEINE